MELTTVGPSGTLVEITQKVAVLYKGAKQRYFVLKSLIFILRYLREFSTQPFSFQGRILYRKGVISKMYQDNFGADLRYCSGDNVKK